MIDKIVNEYKNIREEELKNKVATDFFGAFDCDSILNNIDFAVKKRANRVLTTPSANASTPSKLKGNCTDEYYLWAEAKAIPRDIIEMMAQLILTMGKARTFDTILPPPYLGCFDNLKIAFVPYYKIQEIFYINDFNWNVTSSNTATKEFNIIRNKLESLLNCRTVACNSQSNFNYESHPLCHCEEHPLCHCEEHPLCHCEEHPLCHCEERSDEAIQKNDNEIDCFVPRNDRDGDSKWIAPQARNDNGKLYIFHFKTDELELRQFIKENFVTGKTETTKIQINKNNFINVYNKWLTEVKPSIQLNFTWDEAKNQGYLDADFYLADLMSENNKTLGDKLFVLLKETMYKFDKEVRIDGRVTFSEVYFKDNQRAHTLFWNRYERPPREEYRDFILDRRDLLVPQDIRERKGSFYTPQIWVELSQKYIADVFGENWQEEYYVWDCAAGTGNLLVGLTEKYRIFASTLDKADVSVMHERIEKGANLLKDYVFQFDFLNDDFDKLPTDLQRIIKECPEKLIVYINPPYAEAAQYGKSKDGVSATKTYSDFKNIISFAVNELFSQFFARIYKDIPNCNLASFSTLKYVVASNFSKFRDYFRAMFLKGFVCHANTFDNVKGQFPIGFMIWDLSQKELISSIECDIFQNTQSFKSGIKKFFSVNKGNVINDWLRKYYDKRDIIGYIRFVGPDFQANSSVFFTSKPKDSDVKESRIQTITKNNLIEMSVYLAVRKVIPATWLNDRDQFLYPNDGWQTDNEFQTNCLTYTLFHNSNNISSKHGVNHWIPFIEKEVNPRGMFASHFMTDFIKGKNPVGAISNRQVILSECIASHVGNDKDDGCHYEELATKQSSPLTFSSQALAVFDAGRELWKYYHSHVEIGNRRYGDRPYNVNASFYDIREYFQGRDEKSRMKSTSEDERYNDLLRILKYELKYLAKQIEPKIYKYGFLKE